MNILLTNDDGIDAPGLRALAAALEGVGDIRVLAPARNQSAVGRGLSYGRMGPDSDRFVGGGSQEESGDDRFTVTIPHAEHELGYAIHGTPCDCVILGTNTFERPDVVVAGCNPGANLGAYVLGRSGTASAAVEAACLGVPGIAVSMDTFGEGRSARGVEAFERACSVGGTIIERAVGNSVFDCEGDKQGTVYLNVNIPGPDRPLDGVSVTRPTTVYEMEARFDGGTFELHNPLWAEMANRDISDSAGTDRRAILNDHVSISPLSLPYVLPDENVIARLEQVFADVADREGSS